ncbi:MAG: hypothetical protein JNM70_07460 [Anaerolineae bacterium]|nr:hypothetical protein [Anaerolineae bacterium]
MRASSANLLSPPIRATAAAVLALILIGVLLWLPFGWNTAFYADAWVYISDAQKGVILLSDSVRPLSTLPWAIVHALSPNSFVGLQIAIMGLLIGKGIALTGLLQTLTGNRWLAFAAGVLLLVYPADEAIFNAGIMSIHNATFFFLLALWMLAAQARRRRWYHWPLIWGALVISVGTYEVVYPLVLVAPLLLVFIQGGFKRELWKDAALWYAVPLVIGLRYAYLLITNPATSGLAYQSGIFDPNAGISDWLGSLARVYGVHLFAGWRDSLEITFAYGGWSGWRNLPGEFLRQPFLTYGIAAFLIAVAAAWLQQASTNRSEGRRLLWLIAAGALWIGLAFLAYLPSALRDADARTFIYTSAGAALAFSALLAWIRLRWPRTRLLLTLILGFMVSIACLRLLDQHQNYRRGPEGARPALRALVEQVPSIRPDSAVVVIDETPYRGLRDVFTGLNEYFLLALRVLYDDPTLIGVICYPDDPQSQAVFRGSCRMEADTAILQSLEPIYPRTYDQLIVLRYTPERDFILVTDLGSIFPGADTAGLYDPTARIDPTAPMAEPARSMLSLGS